MDPKQSPVWAVYDKLRTARLNCLYYGRRLAALERQNFWMEVILATTAPSSAIAGLWLWQTEWGKQVWAVLGVGTAILAILKPILGLAKRIKDFESVTSGYRMVDYDLREIKTKIEQRRSYDEELRSDFQKVTERERALVEKTPEPNADQKLVEACEAEVLKQLPKDNFFIPAE